MNKVLTISIAAYNVENYLDKLLRTIIDSNKLDELEVLIINDGSKDRTAEIAMDYQRQFPGMIKLINKKNGGHGSTINKGIELAKGKYFKAIDGDDWVVSENLAKLVEKLGNEEADLVFCHFENVYEDLNAKKIIKMDLPNDKLLEFDEASSKINNLCFHNIYLKTEILRNHSVKLEENCFYVDNELDCYPLLYVNTVKQYDLVVYCYRLGRAGQSVSTKSLQQNELQRMKVITNLLSFYGNNKNKMSYNKRIFIANFIARIINSQLDILFSFPFSIQNMQKTIQFDNKMKEYPDIYVDMNYKTFKIWRKNRILLFIPTKIWCHIKMGIKKAKGINYES